MPVSRLTPLRSPAHWRLRKFSLLACLWLFSAYLPSVWAQTEPAVPEPLQAWVPWVLEGSEADCAWQQSERLCALSGTLQLSVADGGADFSLRTRRFTPGLTQLPGSRDSAWPLDVRVNGKAVPVLAANALPVVELPAGSVLIEGRFEWRKAPERLLVPERMPLVLQNKGLLIPAPERLGDELWLGRAQSTERAADALEVRVNRLLRDGLPMLLESKIELRVSGEAREVKLGPALLPGFTPLDLQGDLNAKLLADGSIAVQLRPGVWRLLLIARAEAPMTEFSMAGATYVGDWPEQESLSFVADSSLRSVQLEGLSGVDPKQANVPSEWQNFPAYLLSKADTLRMNVDSRGREPNAPNRLSLERVLWLDFSGKGFSTKDTLSGEMVRDWRIDMRPPYVMTRAQSPDIKGIKQPFLITQSAGATGVELRSTAVQLFSASRIESRDRLPATGFNTTIEKASYVLNTPPGWQLIAAPGSTEAPYAWVQRWNVYTAFIIALCALAAQRFGGWGMGAAVLGFAVISAFEYDAPRISLLILLLLSLLVRQVRGPIWQLFLRFIGAAFFAVLVLNALGFVHQQLRLALHPQLEYAYAERDTDNEYLSDRGQAYYQAGSADNFVAREVTDAAASASEMPIAAAPPPPPPPPPEPSPQMERQSNIYSKVAPRRQMNRLAANSVVQAGAAEPNWDWNRYRIEVAGPITPEQELGLVLMPPWLTALMRVLTSALLIFVLWRLAKPGAPTVGNEPLARGYWWQSWTELSAKAKALRSAKLAEEAAAEAADKRGAMAGVSAALLALTLAFCASLHPRPASAFDSPDPKLLNELKQRLTRAPACVPECVLIADAQTRIEQDEFRLDLLAHVGARSLVHVPTGGAALSGLQLSVDGVASEFVQRVGEGYSSVLLEPGIHLLSLRARARADRVVLDFPQLPQRVRVATQGWEAVGVRDERLTSNSLDFVRSEKLVQSQSEGKTSAQFPAYIRVLRQLQFDLDWQVVTTVERLTNSDSGMTVRLPLLPGERPLGADIQVVDGHVLVPMQAGQASREFSAALAMLPELELRAPLQRDRVEVWTVQASPIWHVDYSGVPLSLTPLGSVGEDVQLRFDPLPEEVLQLKLTRPTAAPGPAFRIDQVKLYVSPGERARDSDLQFTLAATQGGRHRITLPAAELLSVSKNGVALTLRLKEQTLELPVDPGENRFAIKFREALALGARMAAPSVDLGLPSANIHMRLYVPASRWLLWASGPTLGPAVLYWASLIVILLGAAALARSGYTALGFGSWALLGLGLAGLGWPAFLIVAGWFLALQWRMQKGATLGDGWHRLVQVLLVGLSALAIGCIVAGAMNGLISNLDMMVLGNGSNQSQLNWFADLSAGALPAATAWSLPHWVYRALMLAWALWLAFALLRWLRYAWLAFSAGGAWRAFPKSSKTNPIEVPASTASAAAPASVVPPLPAKTRPALVLDVRQANTDDLALLQNLAKRCLSVAPWPGAQQQAWEAMLEEEFSTENLITEMKSTDTEYWVAQAAGEAFGFLKLVHGQAAPHQRLVPASEIAYLAQAPNASGMGVGGELLKRAVARAKAVGSDTLWIKLEQSDQSTQAIYRSYGFAERGGLPVSNALGEFPVLIYARDLE